MFIVMHKSTTQTTLPHSPHCLYLLHTYTTHSRPNYTNRIISSNATWALVEGHCLSYWSPRHISATFPYFQNKNMTTSALSFLFFSSSEGHHWIWDRCHFAFRSVSSSLRAVFPSPRPRTLSQPRAHSAFSATEGCNLLETSAMTLLLLLNSWLSCGVTWGRATNLAEPDRLGL